VSRLAMVAALSTTQHGGGWAVLKPFRKPGAIRR
jgi:hypothetical protein